MEKYNPIVMYANYAKFIPSSVIYNQKVISRMLLWCISGKGLVQVDNYPEIQFQPGMFLVTPFNHNIKYQANRINPYFLCGIHFIPHLGRNGVVNFKIQHGDIKPGMENNIIDRQNGFQTEIPDFIRGNMSDAPQLIDLANFIVKWFISGARNRDSAFYIGKILLNELITFQREGLNHRKELPPTLRQLIEFIKNHCDNPINTDQIIKKSGLSRATVFRWFKQYLNCGINDFILQEKMNYAGQLLLNSNLSIKEIAAKCCINDYYYFGKIFKRYQHLPPARFRNEKSLLL